MNNLLKSISKIDEKIKENQFEENLFVKNIIVNKEKSKKVCLTYIPTEKWVEQLGARLELNH